MILEDIKFNQLAARKAGRVAEAILLTTVIGEAEMVGKNAGNRKPTEEEVIKVLKRFESNQVDNIEIFKKKGFTRQISNAEEEVAILHQYLPKALTDAEVKAAVLAIPDIKIEMKSMGMLGKELQSQFGPRFDGKQLSKVMKEMINATSATK